MADVGALIRTGRRKRGWSQNRLAAVLIETSGRETVTGQDVSRWELGRRTPRYWLPYLAGSLGIDLAELERAAFREPDADAEAPSLNADDAGALEGSALPRRRVVGYLGAGIAATGYLLPDIARRLSGALLLPARDEPSDKHTADIATLPELTAQVERAWQLRQQAEYGALARHLTKLIPEVETSAANIGGDKQCEVLKLVVHTYNAASSLLKRLGDIELGLIAADRAVRIAESLDDPLLSAAASYRLANVLLAASRLDETRSVAIRAANLVAPDKISSPLALASWGGLLLTSAVAAARMSDVSGAWELLGEARVASRLLGVDYADIYTIFGPMNVAIHSVQVAAETGNGYDAVRRGQQVNAERLPASMHERRGQFLIDLAHGYVLVGGDGAAIETLLRAERAAPEEVQLNPTSHDLVGEMLSRERLGATPGLRGLAQRIGFQR